jgi:succinyl-diaminopimelate desuccinylase
VQLTKGINNFTGLINVNDLIRMTQKMVQIPSINPPGDEAEVAKYVRSYFQSKGIKTVTQEVLPGRYNVIARLKGKGEAPALMFSSHMDVVPVSAYEAKRWDFGPFSGAIDNGYLHGRGSADAKGGLAAVMTAMGSLSDNKIRPKGDIVLAATVDEENLMRGAKELIESPLVSDVERAICCEPTNLEVQTCSKGRMWAEVTVFGQTAHASVKGAGVNAIHRALRVMTKMEAHSFSNKGTGRAHQYINGKSRSTHD